MLQNFKTKLSDFFWKSRAGRFIIASTFSVISATDAMAQNANAGVGAFSNASSAIQQYQEPVKKLLYTIAAVIVLVGIFRIFNKMQNGDQDVQKTIMLVLGGCIAMVVFAQALPLFFE